MSRLTRELIMSSWGMLALLRPFTSYLPSPLGSASKTTGVPRLSLLVSCVMAALLAALSFGKLVVIDVLLYSAALSLEFVALIVLRRNRPDLRRPFRVPAGWLGILLVTLAPLACAIVLLAVSLTGADADPKQAMIVAGVIVTGIALYFFQRKNILG